MAVLKCNMCGGELDVNADLTVGKCQYCDSTITIPKEIDKKGNLYNRAVFLRQNNEFDNALSAYEEILREDNSDAEAHWGLVLSKFGIEYVKDPLSGERIPTCHRVQTKSILTDPDYLAAFQYADNESKKVFEREAVRIHEIQTKFLDISAKEPPYDIFICYKETDGEGNRTEDSTLAYDIYSDLTKKGYKVFFSRKTLEGYLGTEYEPIIFAALNSARIMLVIGTKLDYFNAVWVKNEWSRFLKLSKTEKKTIIPAYRGMSPYELPSELSMYQAQDMSKIGFIQDLTDGIEKLLRSGKKPEEQVKTTEPIQGTGTLARLLQNAQTYTKLGNYPSAEEVYSRISKEYPEEHRGWWGLIICKTKNFSEVFTDLTPLNTWFGYTKQLADPGEFSGIETLYIDYVRKSARLSASDEIVTVHNSTVVNTEKMHKLENAVSSIESSKAGLIASHNSLLSNIASNISEMQKTLQKYNNALSVSTAKTAFGIISLLAGIFIILFSVGASNFRNIIPNSAIPILVPILVIIFGIRVISLGVGKKTFGSRKKRGEIKQYIHGVENNLSVAFENKINQIKKHQADLQNAENEKAAYIQQMNDIYVHSLSLAKYFEIGEERISHLLFAYKCAAFGSSQPIDADTVALRNAAFNLPG